MHKQSNSALLWLFRLSSSAQIKRLNEGRQPLPLDAVVCIQTATYNHNTNTGVTDNNELTLSWHVIVAVVKVMFVVSGNKGHRRSVGDLITQSHDNIHNVIKTASKTLMS